jgi:hypothetical protein
MQLVSVEQLWGPAVLSSTYIVDEADGRMSGVGSGMQVRGDASAWELQAVWRTAKA